MNIVPVILCGGAGTRLWPLSRTSLPKQLLRLGKHSLLQETALRAHGENITAPVLVCADEYEHLVRDQLDEISCPPHTVIVEPVGRNTAPAVTMRLSEMPLSLSTRCARWTLQEASSLV